MHTSISANYIGIYINFMGQNFVMLLVEFKCALHDAYISFMFLLFTVCTADLNIMIYIK